MSETQSSPVRVFANDAFVGELSVDELKKIRRASLLDWTVYGRQFGNVFTSSLRLVSRVALVVPVMWFWLAAALAIWDPSGLAQLLAAVIALPAKLPEVFAQSVYLTTIVSLLAVAAEAVMLPRSYGFCNHYEVAVNKGIRQSLKLPFEATLKLVFPKQNRQR